MGDCKEVRVVAGQYTAKIGGQLTGLAGCGNYQCPMRSGCLRGDATLNQSVKPDYDKAEGCPLFVSVLSIAHIGLNNQREIDMTERVNRSLHNEIMNLQTDPSIETLRLGYRVQHKQGHRDARHAAAELAAEYESITADLVEALEDLMALESRDRVMPAGPEWDKARAALAKAYGETS